MRQGTLPLFLLMGGLIHYRMYEQVVASNILVIHVRNTVVTSPCWQMEAVLSVVACRLGVPVPFQGYEADDAKQRKGSLGVQCLDP